MRFLVDAYEFRETYSRRRGMPDLEREWKVASLFRRPSPGEPPAYLGDGHEFVRVERTDALADLGGVATYVVAVQQSGN